MGLAGYLSDDVDSAHHQLVEVPSPHQLNVMDEAVLETRPHLTAQLRVHAETFTQLTQTHTAQVVDLKTDEGDSCRPGGGGGGGGEF